MPLPSYNGAVASWLSRTPLLARGGERSPAGFGNLDDEHGEVAAGGRGYCDVAGALELLAPNWKRRALISLLLC
jgi:hypothetical protein